MARDYALLGELAGSPLSARTYRWSGPWVSLGRFQRPEAELLPGSGVPWVVRPTGGKAVLHGHDLTLGLAARLDWLLPEVAQDLRERAVKRAYRALAQPLVAALRACGLDARLAEQTPFSGRGQRTADCFAHVSPNDIVDAKTGAKVCGCALLLARGAVLLQASIPEGVPLVPPSEVFALPNTGMPVLWDSGHFAEELAKVWSVFR